MNKMRRKRIEKLADALDQLQCELEEILAEEEEYRDNIPENLCGSERYEAAEIACDNLSSADESLGDAIESLRELF